MKKLLVCLLVLGLAFSMVGCGGGEKAPEEKGLTSGYWVVEKIVMDGTEFAGEELTSLFGPADSIMALAFNADNTYNGVYFEDYIEGSYSGTEAELELDFSGEKAKGVCSSDGILELTLDEDSGFTLKNQKEMPASLAGNPWVTYSPDFSAEETAAMSNFMAACHYYIENDVLYGLTHKESSAGALGAMPFHMKGAFPEFEETLILDGSGFPSYLCKDGDYLYYINNYEKICCVKTDGSDAKVLYEGACDYLQIHEGRLYFTDADYHFVSTDMEGQGLATVVDKEIYYPYFIGSDWMIFQDDADDESLHLYNTTHGTEVNITYIPSYNPVMDGKYLYYTDYSEEGWTLCRIDMSDPDTFYFDCSDLLLRSAEFMIDDAFFYTTNQNSVAKEDWKKLSDTDDVTTESQVYVSVDYTIYHEYDSEGLIIRKGMMSKEMGGGNPFN